MKREKLESYIGKKVKVLLFDGDCEEGILQKTATEAVKHDDNLYLKGGYYVLLDQPRGHAVGSLFRCSHVTRLKEVS